jgi:hypothetical protein
MRVAEKIVPLDIEGLTFEQNREIEERLVAEFLLWEGTPHRDGQQQKGIAVDCVRFVAGVIDSLYGTTTEIARLPQDASFHSKETCFSAFRSFMVNFPHTKVEDGIVQPGDIIITGPRGGGPGHAVVTGVKYLWHCDSQSVVRTGLKLTSGGVYFPIAVLRGKNREEWLHV